jgi:NADH-quinone oxidoreductase subunit N
MNITQADFAPLVLDALLCAGILLVFIVDLFFEAPAVKKSLGWLTALILAAIFAASFELDTEGSAFGGVYEGGAWALFFKRVFLVIGILSSLGSVEHLSKHQPHRQGEYYLLMLFSLLGMTLLPGARDLILLLVSFELMSVPLFVLAAYAKSDARAGADRFAAEAGLKLYMVGVVSTALTLFGLSFVFGSAGTTRIAELANHPSPLLGTGMILVLAGMGFKIGAVPFHMWVLDTY